MNPLKTYFFEVYTFGPNGEEGWDIKVGHVLNCRDQFEAAAKVKTWIPKFDRIIDLFETKLSPLATEKHVILR